MIGMTMGQKDMMYLIIADVQLFQVGQYTVSAAGINHKVFVSIGNSKTCGITFTGNGKACAKGS
jgi:hypothetical protein